MVTPIPAKLEEIQLTAGIVLGNASVNDLLMCKTFEIISKCDATIANAIFYTIDSFNMRKELLERVLDRTRTANDADLVNAIIKAGEKANKQRQRISHALLSGDNPDLTKCTQFKIIRPKHRVHEMVTKDMLADIRRNSIQSNIEGYSALQKLCEKYGVPLKLVF